MNIFSTRKPSLQDAEVIAQLATELGYPTSGQQCLARLKALLQSPEHRIIVACDALNIVVGWIHVYLAYSLESDPYAEIAGLIVTADYRKTGIGGMLIKAVEEWVKKSGVKKLRVRSRVERDEAQAFYTHSGFKQTKQQNVFDKVLR